MKSRLQLAALIYLFLLSPPAMAFTKELTVDELQTHINSKFPIEKRTPLVTVNLSDPIVILEDQSDRIGITLTVSALGPGNISGR